jgi:hypothetical protein
MHYELSGFSEDLEHLNILRASLTCKPGLDADDDQLLSNAAALRSLLGEGALCGSKIRSALHRCPMQKLRNPWATTGPLVVRM